MEQNHTQTQPQQEVDDKGVPLNNRFKEFERKMEDKYQRELEQTRAELRELKTRVPEPPQPQQEDVARAELMEFVKSPDNWYKSRREKERQEDMARDFTSQVPKAEAWLNAQKGFEKDDMDRINQIILEKKLNTLNHTPLERAEISWKLLQAEKHEAQLSSQNDNKRREASIQNTAGEGQGKNTPKQSPTTRADIIRKLADAEKTGDLDAAIRYTSMLEDVR